MAIYNTYQEAKIAMPNACIIEDTDSGLFFGMPTREGTTLAAGSRFAEPRYYCMTVERFLADGHKFVDKDAFIDADGYAKDDVRFILRAAALEKKEENKELKGNGHVIHPDGWKWNDESMTETPFLQTGEDFEHSKTLNFIRGRLVEVHGENASYDYMHKLNNAIAFVEGAEREVVNYGAFNSPLKREDEYLKSSNEYLSKVASKIIDDMQKEKPKRTKVGYEKVEFATDYEHLKLMIDGESFYSWDGEIKYSFNGARFIGEEAPNHAGSAEWTTKRPTGLHRRVETEITEREFIDSVFADDCSHESDEAWFRVNGDSIEIDGGVTIKAMRKITDSLDDYGKFKN